MVRAPAFVQQGHCAVETFTDVAFSVSEHVVLSLVDGLIEVVEALRHAAFGQRAMVRRLHDQVQLVALVQHWSVGTVCIPQRD